MKARVVVAVLLAIQLSCASTVFAANALLDSDDVAAGTAVVGDCDAPVGKWAAVFGPSGAATTTSVVVSNIATTCNGHLARLTVQGAAGASLSQATAVIGGCTASPNSCSAIFAVSATTTAVTGIAMAVTGP